MSTWLQSVQDLPAHRYGRNLRIPAATIACEYYFYFGLNLKESLFQVNTVKKKILHSDAKEVKYLVSP
jgi:hypothetical protein